jgi:hypothetical protein
MKPHHHIIHTLCSDRAEPLRPDKSSWLMYKIIVVVLSCEILMRLLSWQSTFLCLLRGFHPCLFCLGDTYLVSRVFEHAFTLNFMISFDIIVSFRFMDSLSLGLGLLQGVRWTLQWDQSLFPCGPQGDSSAGFESVCHTSKGWNRWNGNTCVLFQRFSQLRVHAWTMCGIWFVWLCLASYGHSKSMHIIATYFLDCTCMLLVFVLLHASTVYWLLKTSAMVTSGAFDCNPPKWDPQKNSRSNTTPFVRGEGEY